MNQIKWLDLLVSFLSVVFLALSVGVAQDFDLPTSDEIIDRYIEALGGESALNLIHSMQIDIERVTSIKGHPDTVAAVGFTLWKGGKTYSEIHMDTTGTQICGHDGTYDWCDWSLLLKSGNFNPPQWDTKDKPPHESSHMNSLEAMGVISYALQLKDFPGRVKVTGSELINQQETWALSFRDKDGFVYKRNFDKETGLLSLASHGNGALPVSFTWRLDSDSGVRFPEQTEHRVSAEYCSRIVNKRIRLNIAIDDSKFEIPDNLRLR